jgi:alkanesulfonate monooxygenase SsuD/methylene tetrahydromethanopterin reductase-like flavin-dependent oxidoreductase (luciferase family)
MFDEAIDLLRVLWSEASPRFDGRFWQVRDIGFEPKPVNGAIPILIGGRNAPARRRAARRGDGWYLIDMEPEAVVEARTTLARDCADAGRSPDLVPLSMYASLTIRDQDVADSEREFPLMGSERQIAAKLTAYRRAGLGHVVLAPRGLETVADHKATLDRIRERIVPEAGS